MDERVFYSDNEVMFRYNLDMRPVPEAFTMHTHNMCEVYIFLGGRASFRIEGSEYRLERGDLLVMRPAEAHCIQVQPDHPYERLSMHFEPTLFDRIDPEHKLLKVFMDREARDYYEVVLEETIRDGVVIEEYRELAEYAYQRYVGLVSSDDDYVWETVSQRIEQYRPLFEKSPKKTKQKKL